MQGCGKQIVYGKGGGELSELVRQSMGMGIRERRSVPRRFGGR